MNTMCTYPTCNCMHLQFLSESMLLNSCTPVCDCSLCMLCQAGGTAAAFPIVELHMKRLTSHEETTFRSQCSLPTGMCMILHLHRPFYKLVHVFLYPQATGWKVHV